MSPSARCPAARTARGSGRGWAFRMGASTSARTSIAYLKPVANAANAGDLDIARKDSASLVGQCCDDVLLLVSRFKGLPGETLKVDIRELLRTDLAAHKESAEQRCGGCDPRPAEGRSPGHPEPSRQRTSSLQPRVSAPACGCFSRCTRGPKPRGAQGSAEAQTGVHGTKAWKVTGCICRCFCLISREGCGPECPASGGLKPALFKP